MMNFRYTTELGFLVKFKSKSFGYFSKIGPDPEANKERCYCEKKKKENASLKKGNQV